MTVAASVVLARVRSQTVDERTPYRWSDAELLRWMSDGQRTIVAINPSATATTATRTLSAGTRQTGPTDCYKMLTVVRNTSGNAVYPVPRELLDRQYPTWHADAQVAQVKHFFIDPADDVAFYVYPSNNGTGSVTITYSKHPPELTTVNDNLSVDDIYQTALIDYVIFRAYQKDSDDSSGAPLAAQHFAAFNAFMGVETAAGPGA